MKTSLKEALDKQGTHELFAAHSYTAMALWCEHNDYNGYAKFFTKQATEEREHAEKFFAHIQERGELAIIGTVDAPKSDFQNLVDIAETALALEQANTRGITEAYELAVAEKDYPAQFMLEGFITEQVEEESWAESMVTLTRRAECPGALFNLDRHISKELGTE